MYVHVPSMRISLPSRMNEGGVHGEDVLQKKSVIELIVIGTSRMAHHKLSFGSRFVKSLCARYPRMGCCGCCCALLSELRHPSSTDPAVSPLAERRHPRSRFFAQFLLKTTLASYQRLCMDHLRLKPAKSPANSGKSDPLSGRFQRTSSMRAP